MWGATAELGRGSELLGCALLGLHGAVLGLLSLALASSLFSLPTSQTLLARMTLQVVLTQSTIFTPVLGSGAVTSICHPPYLHTEML